MPEKEATPAMPDIVTANPWGDTPQRKAALPAAADERSLLLFSPSPEPGGR